MMMNECVSLRNWTNTCVLNSQEQEMLYRRSAEVSTSTFERPDRHVKLWVKLVTPLIKNFFWGAATHVHNSLHMKTH